MKNLTALLFCIFFYHFSLKSQIPFVGSTQECGCEDAPWLSGNLDIECRQVFLWGTINCPTEEYKLIFHDEFDGPNLDLVKWTPSTNSRRHGDYWESQLFVGEENLSFFDGKLIITAKEDPRIWQDPETGEEIYFPYTSGEINSRWQSGHSFKYGKYEIRCKLPGGYGLFPAFWLFGNGHEIDVFESFGKNNDGPNKYWQNWGIRYLHSNVHLYEPCDGGERIDWSEKKHFDNNFSDDFHTMSVEWSRDLIIWYVDGEVVRIMPRHWNWLGQEMFCNYGYMNLIENLMIPHKHQYVIANLSIGNENVAGNTDVNTPFPSSMEIDYIRVYQRDPDENHPDLCDYQIEGELSICSENEYFYSFELHENVEDIIWSISDNLTIVYQNENEILITSNTDNVENAWLQVEIQGIEDYCPINIFTIDIQINPGSSEFDIVELVPACFPASVPASKYVTLPLTNVTWDIDNGSIAPNNSTSTSVIPAVADWFTLTATANSLCGESYSISKSFFAEHCFELIEMVKITPNPSDNLINIDIEHTFNTNDTFDIMIINQYYAIEYLKYTDQNTLQVDVSSFSSGVYRVFVQRDGKFKSTSFVVIH